MRRNFFTIYLLLLGLFSFTANAEVYSLSDGGTVSGEPISYNEVGLIVRQTDGSVSTRIPWEKFTEDALQQLLADAKNPRDKSFIEPLLEDTIDKTAERKEIKIKEAPKPERPTKNVGVFAGFSSPVFLVIFLILYAANIYAAYEIALYKYQLPALVCGVSAIIPFIGPIIFLCISAKPDPRRDTTADAPKPVEAPVEEVPVQEGGVAPSAQPIGGSPAGHHAPTASQSSQRPAFSMGHAETGHAEVPAAAPTVPAPIVFSRGEFSFNRRFFETKLAGFFRVVPGEAERDMVIAIKSLRGDFVGKRISRVTQTELYLQVFKDEATHDEMLPFTEIQEVRIRHKDVS